MWYIDRSDNMYSSVWCVFTLIGLIMCTAQCMVCIDRSDNNVQHSVWCVWYLDRSDMYSSVWCVWYIDRYNNTAQCWYGGVCGRSHNLIRRAQQCIIV